MQKTLNSFLPEQIKVFEEYEIECWILNFFFFFFVMDSALWLPFFILFYFYFFIILNTKPNIIISFVIRFD